MSLLMEALRKAEEAKRRASAEQTPPSPEIKLKAEDDAPAFAPPPMAADSVAKDIEAPIVQLADPEPELDNNTAQKPAHTDNSPSLDEPLAFRWSDEPDEPDTTANEMAEASDEPTAAPFEEKTAEPAPTSQSGTEPDSLDEDLLDAASSYEWSLEEPGVADPKIDEKSDFDLSEDNVADTEPSPETAVETPPEPAAEKPAAAAVKADTAAKTENDSRAIESVLSRARNQDKASVRSVFAAKTRGKSSPARRYIMLAGASLLPLSLLVIWLSAQLDLFGGGNQYYVAAPLDTSVPDSAAGEPVAMEETAAETVAIVSTPEAEPTVDTITDTSAATVATGTLITQPMPPPTARATPIEAVTPEIAAETEAEEPAASEGIPEIENAIADTTADVPVTQERSGPESPVQISRSTSIRNPDMQMMTAWSAYQQGNFASARDYYRDYLTRDPDNRDALLGLAASAMQVNDIQLARQTYARLLVINPRDPLARNGLLDTTAYTDPIQRESELKSLRNDHPDIAGISYSLGTLYAEQQRWREAQEAFYDALLVARTQGGAPVSPDYAFSLAVALERISQPLAALSFYREAQALAQFSTPGFDLSVLDQRLQALEEIQP